MNGDVIRKDGSRRIAAWRQNDIGQTWPWMYACHVKMEHLLRFRTFLLFRFLVWVLMTAVALPVFAEPLYEVRLLPELAGDESRVFDMEELPGAGDVAAVGESKTSQETWRAVYWEGRGENGFEMEVLPASFTARESRANGLFGSGGEIGIVGVFLDEAGARSPVLWFRDSGDSVFGFVGLPRLGGQTGEPMGGTIRGAGDVAVVGSSETASGVSRAVLWTGNVDGFLLEMLPGRGEGLESRANDLFLNDGDIGIVGAARDAAGNLMPALWIPDEHDPYRNYKMSEMPLPEGGVAGEVLGFGGGDVGPAGLVGWYENGFGEIRACRWTVDRTDFAASVESLDEIPGSNFEAVKATGLFRNDGDLGIVGLSTGGGADAVATLWFGEGGGTPEAYDLNDLTVNGFLLELRSARAACSVGDFAGYRIAGNGCYRDASKSGSTAEEVHAFVLDPQVLATGVDAAAPRSRSGIALGASPIPFNPRVTLAFERKGFGFGSLKIYGANGRHVTTLFEGSLASGRHEFDWDGRGRNGEVMGSGVYFAVLETNEGRAGKRLVLIR